MSGTLTNIVLVQYFPGTEEYIVYREGAEAELYRGGAAVTDQDFYLYAQECVATGCVCESTFHIATGRVEGNRSIQCKQYVYCKDLAEGASAKALATGAKGMAAGVVSTVASVVGGQSYNKRDAQVSSSNISWVKWNPAIYELTVCSGKIPIPRTHRIHDLSEASEDVLDFMLMCHDKNFIALSRSYRRPIQTGRQQHIMLVTEYYFAVNKSNKDFQGKDAVPITEEDLQTLGLV